MTLGWLWLDWPGTQVFDTFGESPILVAGAAAVHSEARAACTLVSPGLSAGSGCAGTQGPATLYARVRIHTLSEDPALCDHLSWLYVDANNHTLSENPALCDHLSWLSLE